MFVVDLKMPAKKLLKRKKGSSLRSKGKAKKSYLRKAPVKKRRVSTWKPVNETLACEARYALACIDPFHPQADGACVPKVPARASYKTSARLYGTFEMGQGSNAMGYCVAKPTIANDLDCVAHTLGASTQGEIITDAEEPASKLTIHQLGELPLANKYLVAADERSSPEAKGRIISAGLRVRYIGDQDSMNGVLYAWSAPSHESIERMTANDFKKQANCRRIPITRKWVTVNASAIDDHELNYSMDKYPSYLQLTSGTQTIDRDNIVRGVCYPFSDGSRVGTLPNEATNDLKGVPIMGFIYIGTEGKPAKFEWEYIQHTEFAYRIEHQLETPNHVGVRSELIASNINVGKSKATKSASDEEKLAVSLDNLLQDTNLAGVGKNVANAVMFTRNVANYAQQAYGLYTEYQQMRNVLPR